MVKDLQLALQEAKHELPATREALATALRAVAAGHGDDDYSALAGFLGFEGRPNIKDYIKNGKVQLIINTPTGLEPWFDEKAIRRAAVNARIPTITTLSAARAAAEGIAALQRGEIRVQALQHLHAERAAKSRR